MDHVSELKLMYVTTYVRIYVSVVNSKVEVLILLFVLDSVTHRQECHFPLFTTVHCNINTNFSTCDRTSVD